MSQSLRSADCELWRFWRAASSTGLLCDESPTLTSTCPPYKACAQKFKKKDRQICHKMWNEGGIYTPRNVYVAGCIWRSMLWHAHEWTAALDSPSATTPLEGQGWWQQQCMLHAKEYTWRCRRPTRVHHETFKMFTCLSGMKKKQTWTSSSSNSLQAAHIALLLRSWFAFLSMVCFLFFMAIVIWPSSPTCWCTYMCMYTTSCTCFLYCDSIYLWWRCAFRRVWRHVFAKDAVLHLGTVQLLRCNTSQILGMVQAKYSIIYKEDAIYLHWVKLWSFAVWCSFCANKIDH